MYKILSILFSKNSLYPKVFVKYGFFLFNTDDNCNVTQQAFAIKDLVVYGFWNVDMDRDLDPLGRLAY